MLSRVAERALDELALIRLTLDGGLDIEKLPPVPEAADENDHRRLVAVGLVNRLGCKLRDVAIASEEAERNLTELLGDWPLANEEIPEAEERVFGFAAYRKAG